MSIAGFASLFALAATLNIAFVAVEYAYSYTKILSARIFNFTELITDQFKEIHNILLLKETLNNIEPTEIGGQSTLSQIEKNKREIEKLESEINIEKETLYEEINSICESKSFSALSLWNFFYSVSILFIIGLESTFTIFAHMFLYSASAFTLLYMIIGWFWGENNTIISPFYSSLKRSIITFLLFLAASIVVAIRANTCCPLSNADTIITPICAAVPFLNFISYYFIIRHKGKSIKSKIKSCASKYQDSCSEIDKDIENLKTIDKVRNQLKDKQQSSTN